MLRPPETRRQALRGFDDDYADIVDYIVRCTHKIWEEGQVELIRTHYTADCVLHTLGGEIRGAQTVIDNTRATLRAFPDRELIPEAVIWDGDDETGFYSSHRILSPMTNRGDSDFGPATGRRCLVRTIADCRVIENRIFEEWLVRDNSALAMQLGFDPVGVARRLAAADSAEPGKFAWLPAEIERVRAGRALAQLDGAILEGARAQFESVWAGVRCPDPVYAGNVRVHGPGGRETAGLQGAALLSAEVLAGLSDARLTVDHVAAIPFLDSAYDVAIRWCLAGRHTGFFLAPPTLRDILVLGVTHWRVAAGRVLEEWTVFDEIAVLRQMFRN
jgi:predicted ester cyclase